MAFSEGEEKGWWGIEPSALCVAGKCSLTGLRIKPFEDTTSKEVTEIKWNFYRRHLFNLTHVLRRGNSEHRVTSGVCVQRGDQLRGPLTLVHRHHHLAPPPSGTVQK